MVIAAVDTAKYPRSVVRQEFCLLHTDSTCIESQISNARCALLIDAAISYATRKPDPTWASFFFSTAYSIDFLFQVGIQVELEWRITGLVSEML